MAQFAQVYMKFFPDAGIRGSKRRAEEVFRQYDQNNDGKPYKIFFSIIKFDSG